jgi:non-canonical purine NTP pyrophosphatase (RdgB/HAM1 family)
MEKIFYVTGNQTKFDNAQNLMNELGINLEQAELDIPEVQSVSLEIVAANKARKAFNILKKPLFVNDAGWLITALNGFPGPYMKYVNKWLTSEDFISLMRTHENREVILRDAIVYIDDQEIKTFVQDTKGVILNEVRGSGKHPSESVISLSDNGLSIAEENERGIFFFESEKKVWEEFAAWLKGAENRLRQLSRK